MAASPGLRSLVTEITTCPICLDDFKDPRSLPCVHSFCLQCLQGHCKVRRLGRGVPCPMCRQEFQVPEDGVESLPHNFFLQNLVDVSSIRRRPSAPSCEACSEPASMYCVDCSQKLCDRCSVPHEKMKGIPHDVRPLGDELSRELIWLRGSFCDKHPGRRLELYCFDCRGNMCMECCVDSHQSHKHEKIDKVAEDFVTSIQSDIKPFPSRISEFREAVKQVEGANEKFSLSIRKIESEVQRKGDELKRLVDDQVTKLMKELDEIKTRSVKDSKIRVDRFELALTALESFQTYASYLTSKGSACDITRAGNDLHVRADELLKTYVTPAEYRTPEFKFVPVDGDKITGGNSTIGALLELRATASDMAKTIRPSTQRQARRWNVETVRQQQYLLSHAQVVHRFPDTDEVRGVTSLNNELYVLRQRSSDQVDVYSTTDFTLLRQLNVPGLSARDMQDIASCAHKQCVYISDYDSECIDRVGLDQSVSRWPVIGPFCLSVTSSCNLLVRCCEPGQNGKLVELSSEDGKPVRGITLQSGIEWPQHGIQLANNPYVVSHGTNKADSRVSLVGSDGRVIHSSSKDLGLSRPCHMAVDDKEFIFVADCNNNRIVLLDPSLNYVRTVVEHIKSGPRYLCYDDVTRRLYVGHGKVVSIVQL